MTRALLIGEWDGIKFRLFDVFRAGMIAGEVGLPDAWVQVERDTISFNYPIADRLPPCVLRSRETGAGVVLEYTEDGTTWHTAP